jgi:hypothetical protein
VTCVSGSHPLLFPYILGKLLPIWMDNGRFLSLVASITLVKPGYDNPVKQKRKPSSVNTRLSMIAI